MKRGFVYHNIGYRENSSLIRNSIFALWPIWHLSDVTPTWNHLSSWPLCSAEADAVTHAYSPNLSSRHHAKSFLQATHSVANLENSQKCIQVLSVLSINKGGHSVTVFQLHLLCWKVALQIESLRQPLLNKVLDFSK